MVLIENDTNTGINVWKWHFCGDAYMMLKYMDAPSHFLVQIQSRFFEWWEIADPDFFLIQSFFLAWINLKKIYHVIVTYQVSAFILIVFRA